MWAEDFALGEMGLMPEQFWALTLREFNLKHAAFSRAEDRNRSLMLEHAMHVGNYDKRGKNQMQRAVNSLRRYPVKPWMKAGRG